MRPADVITMMAKPENGKINAVLEWDRGAAVVL